MEQGSTDKSVDYRRKLIYISLAYCLFFLLLHYRAPMQDGDSFEYAGIARNIMRYGLMQEDLLRNYTIPDQPLPHPASIRANYYVYFLVPFYAIFRDTQWTFIIPAFLGLFLLPQLMFRFLKPFFRPQVCYYAAIITLLCPSVLRLYTLMDPGLPEVWQMVLYVLFVYCMLKEKYVFAGICMAVAFSLRRNSVVLIPAALAWLFFYRRKHFFGLPLVKVFGVALIFVMPFFVRNYMVFNDPMYNEQFAGMSRVFGGQMIDRFADGDLFGVIFNYGEYYNNPAPDPGSFSQKIKWYMEVVGINVKMAVWGKETAIFYIPGIFQIAGLLLVPFFIWGWLSKRGSPEMGLVAGIVVLQLLFHVFFPFYSDRYLLGVLPLIFIVAVVGLKAMEDWLERGLEMKFTRSITWAVVVFVIISESAGFFVMSTARLLESESAINELDTICDSYVKPRAGREETVMMSYPFFATHFVCDRKTIPMPYGNLLEMAQALEQYEGEYIVYSRVWPGDLFPSLPFAKEVIRGRKISLFEVDKNALYHFIKDGGQDVMPDFNPVSYFLSNHFNFEMSPPFYKIAVGLSRSYIAGLLLYLLTAALFVIGFVSTDALRRYVLTIVICLVIITSQLYHVGKVFTPMTSMNPNVSRIQATDVVKKFPEKKREIVMIVETTEKGSALVKTDLEPLFRNAALVPVIPEFLTPNTTVFVPVPRKENLIADEITLTENLKQQEMRLAEMERLKKEFEKKGYTAISIYGGVFAY